jgi:hypothetical protein
MARTVPMPEPRAAGAWGLLFMATGLGAVPPRIAIEHDVVARQAARILRERHPAVVVSRSMPLLAGERRIRLQTPAAFVGGQGTGERTYVFVQKVPLDPSQLDSDRALLAAADRVAHATPGARLYYDDDVLRVYVLPPARGAAAADRERIGAGR